MAVNDISAAPQTADGEKGTTMGDKLKVYVAGPYTRGDVAANVRSAIEAGDWLAARGFVPYIPHLTHFWHLLSWHPIEFWYEYDNEWLRTCDIVLRLPGESAGADAETELAEKLGKSVYYDLGAFCSALGIH